MSEVSLPSRVHLVGIGGAGMSAIAHYLLDMKIMVTGSDTRVRLATTGLRARGCTIYQTHDATHINGADLLVFSDAVSPHNPEILEAIELGIPVKKRALFLQDLGSGKSAIHVTGTHGKTTTAAMIATVLTAGGTDPGFIVGADVIDLGDKRARASAGGLFVVEACEAFRNLSHYDPDYAVITNIDDDHLEHYGSQAVLDKAFADLANRVSEAGTVFVNGDDVGIQRIWPTLAPGIIRYGLTEVNDLSVSGLVLDEYGSRFSVRHHGSELGRVSLSLPGRHTVENSMACLAVCLTLGIGFTTIATALSCFKGTSRRWKDHGKPGGIRIIEDFAHHPTELRVNHATASLLLEQGKRLVLAFQPQQYSRTYRMSGAYADVISDFDAAFLLEVDAGGESPEHVVGSQAIIDQLNDPGHTVSLHQTPEVLVEDLGAYLKPGDVVLMAGGSGIQSMVKSLASRLRRRPEEKVLLKRLLGPETDGSSRQDSSGQVDHALSLVERNFRTIPASTAVSCGADSLTYAELDIISSRLSNQLTQRGIKRSSLVALGLPASLDLIACQVSVLRAAGSCLTLDEKLPGRRLSFMLEAARADVLITQKGSCIDRGVQHIEKIYIHEIVAEPNPSELPENSDICEPEPASGQDAAFVCFTSGSTGQPKGIPLSHAALFAFMPAAIERFQLTGASKTVLNSSLAFDASIAEIMLTLSAGGEIHIPEYRPPLVGRNLHSFIDSKRITHLFATPSVLSTLPASRLDSLDVIVSGGEVCPQSLADDMSVHALLINGYGPTEATIYATAWTYAPDQAICIGTPLAHVDVYILDMENRLITTGNVGEICLGGAGVCSGYLSNGIQYPEKFISIQHGQGLPVPVYKTGDLGRFRKDGQIEYVGRIDNQVKIRGNRVELEEIDAALLKLDAIVDAVACQEESGQKPTINVYYTTVDGMAILDKEFSRLLSAWLPDYMMPSSYVKVAQISQTVTGKKDRKETARRNQHRQLPDTKYIAPVGDTQVRLAALWQTVLGAGVAIGQSHGFSLLGGDSLNYMLLLLEIEDEFSIVIPPGFFGKIDSLRLMAKEVDQLRAIDQSALTRLDMGFEGSYIYKQQRTFVGKWIGRKHEKMSLIVSNGREQARYQLFWCLQTGKELNSLALALGEDYCVHGMRSGHLVMDYTEENVTALSTYYAEEISRIYPDGTLYFGGNCQGGQVAHAVALLLEKQGRDVQLLILMEQARFPEYEGRLAFIYGKGSFLNPHTRYDDGLSKFDIAYPQGYSLDIIPGSHGGFFTEPNIFYLASRIQSSVENTNFVTVAL